MTFSSLRAALFAFAVSACAPAAPAPAPSNTAAPNSSGWIDLLAGSADAWRGFQRPDLPAGWTYDPATRVLTRTAPGGDIITRQQFTDFDLELEWRVGSRGNSGVFFHATETTPRIYENSPEVQILDNTGHADGRNSLTSAGANYALHAPAEDLTRPVGEWNALRLVVRGPRVEQWLNGTRQIVYDRWTDDWKAKVAASKFAQWPSYGLATRGHIGLQDHGDIVSFRNIRIRELAR